MAPRSLYLQCFAGVSGDMFLATLLGLGLPEEYLRLELRKLDIEDEFVLKVSTSDKQGISGLRVDVETSNVGKHSNHSHIANQRDYKDIKVLINGSSLSDAVKSRALKMFGEVARAEAKIHNQEVDTVHFHEVGATDSIVDIVGAAIGLEYLAEELKIARIYCSTVELGSGFVNCAHGDYPVPAPATAQILQETPVSIGRVNGEATTPTGAAILKVCVDEFTDSMSGSIQETIYGIGHRDANVPNVLRAHVIAAKPIALEGFQEDYAYAKIEVNIDDMSPEAYASLYECLFDAGASDVFLQNIAMKKLRPAQMLTVLCKAENAEELGNVVLNNSTTIGLRILPFKKMFLPREMVEVPTTLGQISVKLVQQPNGIKRWKSEYDHIHRISQEIEGGYLEAKGRIDLEIHQYLSEQGFLDNLDAGFSTVKKHD